MTVLCGGGTSGPKPNQPVISFLTGATIEQILIGVFGLSDPWAALIVFAAAQSVDWSLLCATDPPAMPTLTGTEVLDILATPWDLTQPAFQHLQDLILRGLWFYGCQCNTTTAPSAGTWPTYPTGAPTVNPPVPTGGTGDCLSINNTTTFHDVGSSNFNDLSSVFFSPATKVAVTGSGFGRGNIGYVIPPGSTKLHIYSVTINNPNNLINSGELDIEYFDTSGTNVGIDIVSAGPSRTLTNFDMNVRPGAVSAQLFFQGASTNTQPVTIGLIAGLKCPSSTAPQQPCCPPDPALSGYLQQILNFVTSIYSSLPVPLRSLAESTVHSGLTGSGNFTVGGSAIGVKIVSTFPSSYGESIGDPNAFFNVGWVTTSAVEGNYRSTPIRHGTELLLFDPLVDQVHYTLSPGVSSDITELVRGP